MSKYLTERDMQVVLAVAKLAIESKSVNWEAVAKDAEFNTAKQARDRFAIVRNKLLSAVGPTDGNSPEPKTKAGRSKKRKLDDDDNAGSNVSPKTPKSQSKGRKTKKVKTPSPSPSEVDGLDEIVVKSEAFDDEIDGLGEDEV